MRESNFVNDIKKALQNGSLKKRFRASDVRIACPGWKHHTYSNFLPKHRKGNPLGYREYFVRHADGSYSLLE